MTRRSERVMPGPPLRGILSPSRHVDDVDGRVHELRAEGGGEVVAPALHEEHLEGREAAEELVRRFEVDGGVLANGGVRAPAGLHAHHALRRQGAASDQELRVLLRIDVVGDHRHVVAVAQTQAERLDEGRLARAHRSADADAKRPGNPGVGAHERKSSSRGWRAGYRPARCRERSSIAHGGHGRPPRAPRAR